MQLTFDDMCDKLRARENFSLARFGDGEFACLLGDDGGNCDSHPYYKDLGLALSAVLLRPQMYHIGMQPKATRDLGNRINKWIADNNCQIDWCDADIIHDASTDGRLSELHASMRGRKKILVGPKHLKGLAVTMQAYFIETPSFPVWKAWTTIYADVTEQLDKDCVVLWCASMATEVMLDKVAREYGDTVTQIDVGSAFDPYCNVRSRRYHKQIIERLKDENS